MNFGECDELRSSFSPVFCIAKYRGEGLIQSQRQLHFHLFYMLRKGVNISINHAHFLIGQHSQFIGDTHDKSPHKETDDTGN